MVTFWNRVHIHSSSAVAETWGRSRDAQVSTPTNAQPRTAGMATAGGSVKTKIAATATHITTPITPVTRPLVTRKVWTCSDIG